MGNIQGWTVRCHECGRMVDTGEVQRREAVIQVNEVRLWWRFTPYRYVCRGLVDTCPKCAAMYDHDLSIQRQRRLLLIGSTGAGLFAWAYLGVTGLLGALVVIIAGAFYKRKAPKVYLPERRNG